MNRIKELESRINPIAEYPKFSAGDTISVTYKIIEGAKERLQTFTGVVIQRRGTGSTETFTIRKMSNSVGVERIIPIASPFIDKIEVNKRGKVRRARIFYLRSLTVKQAVFKKENTSGQWLRNKNTLIEYRLGFFGTLFYLLENQKRPSVEERFRFLNQNLHPNG